MQRLNDKLDLISILLGLISNQSLENDMIKSPTKNLKRIPKLEGAIMFGDSLLPSECSLIVEELKQTSLCFQCAHGRPTTVPLVNLDALHKQISDVCGVGVGDKSWHGLSRHKVSLERSTRRLRCSQ